MFYFFFDSYLTLLTPFHSSQFSLLSSPEDYQCLPQVRVGFSTHSPSPHLYRSSFWSDLAHVLQASKHQTSLTAHNGPKRRRKDLELWGHSLRLLSAITGENVCSLSSGLPNDLQWDDLQWGTHSPSSGVQWGFSTRGAVTRQGWCLTHPRCSTQDRVGFYWCWNETTLLSLRRESRVSRINTLCPFPPGRDPSGSGRNGRLVTDLQSGRVDGVGGHPCSHMNTSLVGRGDVYRRDLPGKTVDLVWPQQRNKQTLP